MRIWFILLSLLLAGLLAGCGGEDQEAETAPVIRPINALTVEPVALGFQRSYPAEVLPAREVDLTFRVSGRIEELPVRAAMEVKQGDMIAQLETRDYQAAVDQLESQREQAEAQLRALQSGSRAEDIAALEASVAAAQSKVAAAREQVERTKTLLEQDVVSRVKLETDETALAVAEAELKVSQEELNKGESGARPEDIEQQEAVIKGLDAQLETARADLADTTLRAPFDGIIARRLVDNFTNVQAKESIVLLQELATLELVFDVPGPDVAKLAASRDAQLTASLDALPNVLLPAELVEFTTQADSATQTYRGRVSIAQPDNASILPGMVGTVNVSENGNGGSVILVPVTAVVSEADGTPYVWVIAAETNATEKRPVETGRAISANIEIASGLSPGDIVATAGLSQLQPGMVVRPVLDGGN